ncbi:UNVERIFIED_CONTAM: hypothetical protein Slati_2670600 [Sesamum latifolium]|uniref:Reverse transcriptase n=1 Tax=Sesamum latifolium TaxID=2727402 RepID=A0AAW2VVP9_9LAMI
MKILAWNCQGLSPSWTVHTLTEMVWLHRPSLVFISKTKCKSRRCDRIKETVDYFHLGVNSVGKGGGLLLLWRKDIDVWLQSFSGHHIDVTVKSDECPERWRFTGFYGYSNLGISMKCWNSMRNRGPYRGHSGRLGTFVDVYRIAGFKTLGSKRWGTLFPRATVLNQDVACSYHAAVWVVLDGIMPPDTSRRKNRFRFEVAWCSTPECAEVIQQAWSSVMEGSPHESVLEKIRAPRVSLLRWNSMCFGNIRGKVRTLDKRICELQALPLTHDRKCEIDRLKDSLENWLGKEELLWKQRAKVHWLAAGDRNTNFFHNKANERRLQKDIKRIKDESGTEVLGKDGILQVILKYFSSMFASTHPMEEAISAGVRCLEPRVTTAMNETLSQLSPRRRSRVP